MLTRQQMRQQERALAKRAQSAVSFGLPQTPDKQDLVALAHSLARRLADPGDPHRAGDAARLILTLNETSARKTPGAARLVCAKGCSYCCHTWVGPTVPELLLLAAAIRERARREIGLVERIIARTTPLVGLTREQRFGAKLPCPLLVDHACSFYRDRPLVCRQATSLDLSGCLDEFQGHGFGQAIKVSAVYIAHARNSRVPLVAALVAVGLDASTYELSAGLARILSIPDAEARWLAGEDVMAGIDKGPEDTAVKTAVDMLVREIGPLLGR